MEFIGPILSGFGSLFGAFGDNDSTQTIIQNQPPQEILDVTPDEFLGLRQPIAGALEGLLGGTGPTGALTAPLGSTEQTFLDRLTSAQPVSSGINVSGELDVQALIRNAQRPFLEGFKDITLPRLQRGFTAAGQFVQPQGSSPFDQAAALAGRDVSNQLAGIATSLAPIGEQLKLQQGQQKLQLSQADLEQTLTSLRAAALPRLIEDLGIERGLAEFDRRTRATLNAVAVAGPLSSPQVLTVPEGTTLFGKGGETGGAPAASPIAAAFGSSSNAAFNVPGDPGSGLRAGLLNAG